jgi:hypothetical protein
MMNNSLNVLAKPDRQQIMQRQPNVLSMPPGGMVPGAAQGNMLGQPFQMRQPDPSLPTQQELDELWATQPTDQTGAMIEDVIRRSGGQLQAPWDRMDPRQQTPMR